MSEMLGNRYEEQENRNNESISVFDSEKYQNDIQSFYLQNKDNFETIQTLKDFLDNQEEDRNIIKEQLEKPVLQEARESLDKQAMINEAKTMLYEKMGISNNLGDNNWGENFGKGLVDTLILENYDLAIQVWETNGVVILDGISELFSSWENLQKMAESLGESVMGLFSLDGYETGKSLAELGLIGSGVGIGVYAGKKTVKFGMKQAAKFRKNAENIVSNLDVKQVIGEVNNKVNEIIPKKELDIDALAKKRIDIKKKIEGLEKLGIPENFSKDILESGILTTLSGKGKFDLLEKYIDFNRNGIDYEGMLNKVIEKTPNLSRKEALLIFSYTDYFLYGKLNSFMRGDKNVLKNMTKENIEATNRIVLDLEQALEKMPNLEPGKDGFILRGDKWDGWKEEVGKEIDLEAFTSVANNKKDAFIGEDFNNNIEISIIGKEGRIKDVSELAIAVNFGVTKEELKNITDFTGKLKKLPKTTNEGIILPNSKVIVLENFQGKDIYYTKVEQIK